MITGTSTTASATVAVASICIPPWPGGELLKQSPCFRPSQGLHCNHRKCVPWLRRHCHLRRTEDCASTPWWTHDLGNFDNLLGNTEIERCEKVHQLFHHLRHNVVKQRDQRHRVDDLLHSALLKPLLRPHIHERRRPTTNHHVRTSRRTPSPPWQYSGSVERCATRAQHSLAQSGAGLLPARVHHKRHTHKKGAHLG